MNLAHLKDLSVTVLLGGNSPERDVSLDSGAAVAGALETLGARVTRLDPADPNWWQALPRSELVFIVLHGAGGEDGTVQGMLETLGLPYTGSGVLASALAMDKPRCKRLWRGLGLPTQAFVDLDEDTDWQAVMSDLGAAFVKPAAGGSSIGTRGVETAAELQAAWRDSRQYGPLIAERLIRGPEYTVAILGSEVLPAIRVETDNAFYDYEAKYLSDSTRYLCPCGLSEAEEGELAALALAAFRSLDCRVWGRVDFMREPDGSFQLLEVNTVPGMTSHSLVPMAAAARGLEFNDLVGSIACLSLED
ncbi:MAG: D-alanine--D-alanine ligase [Halieaceae bacterium]|nr:D-alanine--D-alanine ligase [Halieaceae bacterium]